MMPQWVRRNFRLKALALVLAVSTWVVVVYATNPPDTRQIFVPVQQSSEALPGRYVLAHPIADIAVRISGTRDQLDAFRVSRVRAVPNFSVIRRPGMQQIPLSVINTDSHVELSDTPSSVTADIDQLGATTTTVVVRPTHTPVGYLVVGEPRSTPSKVELLGASRLLGTAQAVVDLDITTRRAALTGLYQLRVVDTTGHDLSNVAVTPGTVRVAVDIEPSRGSASALVVPTLTGDVAPGYQLTGYSIEPRTVVLSGAQDLLNGTPTVATVPISIAGATVSASVTVPLQVPSGLTADQGRVTVRISIAAIPGATVPPSANPTPSLTPRPPSPTPCPSPTPPILGATPRPCP